MKKILFSLIIVLVIVGCIEQEKKEEINKEEINKEEINKEEINLPKPKLDSDFSIEKTLSERISIRNFKDEPLNLQEISQLLWAAQGIDAITGATRAAPSAGATQPLEIYLVVKDVNGLNKGVYHYNAEKHTVKLIADKDVDYGNTPVFIVIAAVYDRTTNRYSTRGIRYVDIEVGHTAQNIHLQAVSLGLGSYPIGAFDDEKIKAQLGIKEEPLYVIPIGKV